MALESKPLFHPEVLRQQVRSFILPEQTSAWQPKLQHWAGLITSGRADQFKETALLPDFLTDIFCGLLGYTGPAEAADTYTLSRERHVEVDGKFADAVLGRFQKDQAQFIAVLEGKGTRDPLDRPFAGRRMSAVDQAYRSPACAARTPPSPRPKSCAAPRSSWTVSCSAPFAKTAACCPPKPSSAPSSTATPTTRTRSGTTSAACSAPLTKAT
ncbi:MAG: hypothetical protein ACLQU3_24010 [Limisphaerales bacterium]